MPKPIIKFVADFGPLLIFFIIYFTNDNDLKVAIPPFIFATIIALLAIYILEKRIPMVPLVSGILITFFGGLTLYFDNKIFFYMKPTIINILFALILFLGKFFTKKPLLKIFFQNALDLEEKGWKILNYRWISFFIFMALLNEMVWRTQTEAFWVNFKVWGLLPRMKHLKLIINNENKKRDIFFNKFELQLILNLYAKMVSSGEWKDYGLSISKKEVSFNVYHRTSEFPLYKITKNLKPKNETEKYLIKDSQNRIINGSENLKNLIKKVMWRKFKLVN